jgi:hypothetical protein
MKIKKLRELINMKMLGLLRGNFDGKEDVLSPSWSS